MSTIERAVYNHIVQVLKDYPSIPKYIHNREQELMAPVVHDDQNIGGGRSNVKTSQFGDYDADGNAQGKPSVTSSTEIMAISIADDRRLTNLEREKWIVDECLDNAGEDTRTIIYELYIKKRQTLTVEGIADAIHRSPSYVRRKRADFFDQLRDELGW